MGATTNEISCIQKARDRQAGREKHLPAKQTLDRLGIAPSTAGMICISGSASMRWKIGDQDPSAHGIGSRMMCRARYWKWRWNTLS
ncbi:MAG: hypothetical protein COA41_06820 [Sphingopyxis sp.]|nr:MAG: hypothetical protein COA41_06820 [Sphingopyxis sp.]